jgi:4-diphosphocytidyl-2-C-methyl-D-erythritol kinase
MEEGLSFFLQIQYPLWYSMPKAYAKINLGLRVREKRPDGFHNISTVFHTVNVFDLITFEQAPEIVVSTNVPEAPSDDSNICHKAAALLRRHLGLVGGVRITITKNIPVGAGLGGGSSDAALVLKMLPRLWGCPVDEPTARHLALQLGSDVPYFLGRGSAVAEGRGELLHYFHLDIPYAILLCNPNIHVATAWAYAHVTPSPGPGATDLRDALLEGIQDAQRLTEELRNDFEPVVFAAHPEAGQVKREMLSRGAVFASMSGSGSTLYGFFPSPREATTAACSLEKKGYRTFLTEPHFSPEEPAL